MSHPDIEIMDCRNPDSARDPRSRPMGRRAFTLFEMMLSALLMLIAASMVLPMFGTNDSTHVSAGAQLIIADLDFTQATAINDPSDDMTMHFDTVTGRWWITPASDPLTILTMTNGDPYDTTMGIGRADMALGVSIALSGVVGDVITYDAYGRLAQATDAVITLTRGSAQTVITIDAELGFLKVQ